MTWRAGRLTRVAVAPEVGQHQPEVRREPACDPVPHGVVLREPVQQNQRRCVGPTADAGMDRDIPM